jgi:hypothetical protein
MLRTSMSNLFTHYKGFYMITSEEMLFYLQI